MKRNQRHSKKDSQWSPVAGGKRGVATEKRSATHARAVGPLGWTCRGCSSFLQRVQVSSGELLLLGPVVCPMSSSNGYRCAPIFFLLLYHWVGALLEGKECVGLLNFPNISRLWVLFTILFLPLRSKLSSFAWIVLIAINWSLFFSLYIPWRHSSQRPGDILEKSKLEQVISLQWLPLPSEHKALQ